MCLDVGNEGEELGDRSRDQMMEGLRGCGEESAFHSQENGKTLGWAVAGAGGLARSNEMSFLFPADGVWMEKRMEAGSPASVLLGPRLQQCQ